MTAALAQNLPAWLLWTVAVLAVARVTRLAVVDEIAAPLRNWVLRRLNPDRPLDLKLAYLIDCQWCQSLWWAGAFGVIVGAFPTSDLVWGTFSVLAASQVTGILGDVRFYLRSHGNRQNNNESRQS